MQSSANGHGEPTTGRRPEVEAEVVIVGAGPTGLLLAAELSLAGVRPLLLEKYPQPRTTQKAQGLGGQILQMLHYRGLLERVEAAVTSPAPPPRYCSPSGWASSVRISAAATRWSGCVRMTPR